MTENWKQLQGQVVDGAFTLIEFLGGSDNAGTFLTATPEEPKLAIKLIPAPSDPAGADTQLAQWKNAADLSHPNLLRIVRSGRASLNGKDLLFVVMEYAEENLSQVLPVRALTADETRELLPPVLDALDYLHGKGLVHGKLHPGNIMAAADQLKLASDGIMKTAAVPKSAGPFDAPEFAKGASPATDLWSLGVTLVEVLTQRRPTWEAGATLPQLPDNLPDRFRVVAQHCLIQDPNLRCKTADIRDRFQKSAPKPEPKPELKTSSSVPREKTVVPVSPRQVSPVRRFAIPAVIAALVIATIVIVSRLDQHPSERPPQAATESEPVVQEKPQADEPAKISDTEEELKQSQSEPEDKPSPIVKTAAAPASGALTPASESTIPLAGRNEVIRQVLPEVSRSALNTITGKVRVRVKVDVDQDGNVSDSEFVSRGPSQYFANSALRAAQQWKFSPSASGHRAWNLQFEFRRSGATVTPTQVAAR